MAKGDRIRRPEPEREGPIRNWSGLLRDAAGDRPAGANPFPGAPDAVGEAVGLGYRVIDDYLRYGQQVARSFSGATRSAAPGLDVMQDLIERTTRNAGEWASLWTAQLSALGANGTAGGHAPGAANGSGGSLRVCVDSPLPIEVSYDLRETPAGRPLVCHPLHATGDEAAPLRDVSLDSESGVPRLSIEVPGDQPPGVYSGVVVDADSGEVRGTVTVEVSGRA